jgi:hypothetical protein
MSRKVVAVRTFEGSKVVTSQGLQLIEKLAASGNPQTLIARELGMDPKTFRAVRKRQPEVDEALELGRAVEERELVDILLAKARKGELVPLLFALKSRHGYVEGRPQQQTVNNVQVVQLPGALSVDEYLKRVNATHAEVVDDE